MLKGKFGIQNKWNFKALSYSQNPKQGKQAS